MKDNKGDNKNVLEVLENIRGKDIEIRRPEEKIFPKRAHSLK